MATTDTPLRAALRKASLKKVEALLKGGADPNEGAPLRLACGLLHLESARLLLEHGADPNQQNPDAYPPTALQACCHGGDSAELRAALVTLLLSKGADPSLDPKTHGGPLHFAAMYKQSALVELLLAAGADVNARGLSGSAPLHSAAYTGNVEVTRMLLAAGADPNAKDDAKDAPIFKAIEGAPLSGVVGLLLDAGVGLDVTSGYGKSLMAMAALCGANAVIALLLERGAPIDDALQEAPIIIALKRGKLETARLLLARGADPETKDLLKYATTCGDKALLKEVLKKSQSKDPTALIEAAARGNLALITLLLEAGVPIDGTGAWSRATALCKAAAAGQLKAVRLLLEGGADLELSDESGNTPLLHAAWGQHAEVITLLLKKGADISAKNKLNWNALMQVCVRGNELLAARLIEAGAALNLIDQERGYTALTIAKLRRAKALVALLAQHGATERMLRRPPPGELFPIFACDVCAYLPQQKDLAQEMSPEDIPYLETIKHDSTEIDRHATSTCTLKRCPCCGTYYEHTHYIDTEDDFAKGGPTIKEALTRCNLLLLADKLDEDRGADLRARYPGLIASFVEHLQRGADLTPKVLPHLLASVTDEYLRSENWEGIEALLCHSKAEVALSVAEGLIDLSARRTSVRPATPEVQEKARVWVSAHHALLESRIRAFEGASEATARQVQRVLGTASYHKLFSAE